MARAAYIVAVTAALFGSAARHKAGTTCSGRRIGDSTLRRRVEIQLDPDRNVVGRLLPGAHVLVDAGGDEAVGRLRRQQQVIDPDTVVLLPGARLIIPEG